MEPVISPEFRFYPPSNVHNLSADHLTSGVLRVYSIKHEMVLQSVSEPVQPYSFYVLMKKYSYQDGLARVSKFGLDPSFIYSSILFNFLQELDLPLSN